MSTLSGFVSTAVADRRGVTSLEYGVIAAVTVVLVATAFATIGGNLTALFGAVAGFL